MDADAYLIYGFVVDEPPWTDDGEDDWEDWIAIKYGCNPPTRAYDEEARAEYSAYWAARREVLNEVGVGFESVGYGEDPTYVLSARRITARYGIEPVNLDWMRETVQVDRDRIFAFCERTGIEFREPAWLLANYLSV